MTRMKPEIDDLTPAFVMANIQRNCAQLTQLRNDKRWAEVEIQAQRMARDLLIVAHHATLKQ